MVVAYLVISLIGVLLWTPILIKFYRSWSARRNPVSLAICAAVVLIMWSTLAGMWLVTGRIQAGELIMATSAMSAAVAIYVHASFVWSKRRFPDSRSGG